MGVIQNAKFASQLRGSNTFAQSVETYGGSYKADYLDGDGHSFHVLLPPSVYQSAHPDWYSGSNGLQICLTNPEVEAEMVRVIKAGLIERPEIDKVYVAQMDMAPLCSCSSCKASHSANGGESGTLIIFVNKIARAINSWLEQDSPGRVVNIQTFAYQSTLRPPTKTVNGEVLPYNDQVIPDKNVTVRMAIDGASFFQPLDDPASSHNAEVSK